MAKKKRVTKKKVQRRAARSRSKASSSSRFHRGAEGRNRVDSELAAQKERQARRQAANQGPYRLYLKPGTTERQVVILDEEPEFFMHEHQIYNGGRKDMPMYTYCGCVKEWETCPVCEEVKDSYYALFLTVLDLEPYKTGAGEEVEFSRKLMCVKPQQQKKFIRRWKKEDTLRGQILMLSRDTDKDPVIGNDIEFEDWMDEDDLAEYTKDWVDRKKKKHTEDCSVPYEYPKIFKEPDSEELAIIAGGDAVPGSAKQAKEELKDDDWDEEEEDTPWDEDEEEEEERPSGKKKKKKAASKKKKKRPSRRARQEEEEEEDEEEEDEEDEELEEEDDEDEDENEEEEDEEADEEEEEERPRRRAKKKRGKKKRNAAGRRRR